MAVDRPCRQGHVPLRTADPWHIYISCSSVDGVCHIIARLPLNPNGKRERLSKLAVLHLTIGHGSCVLAVVVITFAGWLALPLPGELIRFRCVPAGTSKRRLGAGDRI